MTDLTPTAPEIVVRWLGGVCPVQSEGAINGTAYDFRARHDHWSMSIGGDDGVGCPDWFYEEAYGEAGGSDAGYMTAEEAEAFIRQAAQKYCEEGTKQLDDL